MTDKREQTVHDKWYNGHALVWLLAPLALLFFFLSGVRRLLFKSGIKKRFKASVPVIVVGNISVGGNGKTPVVLALAEYYKSRGLKVGILSRGYGAKSPQYPRVVTHNDPANEVGDEPRLLAGRSGCIVVIDPVRSRGAAMLQNECGCDLIICDDGLQHYALHRDVELVVMDERLVGSGYLLPMGPLREGQWRLANVDAIVHNARSLPSFDQSVSPQFLMSLEPSDFVNVADSNKTATRNEISTQNCKAMAGIGDPKRFFNQLKAMGITLNEERALADHFAFSSSDIPSGRVLMTEKDAVKARAFAHDDCWYLPVTARLSPDFYQLVDAKLLRAGLALDNNQ